MTPHDNVNDQSASASGCCCGHTPASENLTNTEAIDGSEGPEMIGLSAGASGGCCGSTSTAENPTNTQSDDVTECPVMVGTPVIKSEAEGAGFYRDYQGQRYWMCCRSCGPLFDADPERYAAA